MRRVVVTGLGAVTPLGIGAQRSWNRLIDGRCGIVSLRDKGAEFQQQKCQVAGLVPKGRKEDGGWNVDDWLDRTEQRRTSKHMQYALAASQEALDDAGWHPESEHDKEMTGVCLGSGIGSFEEIYNTSLAFAKGGAKKVSPFFVPKLLINMAAGQISMKYGFKGPSHSVSTACTTGAHSIGDASRFISHGDANVMLAGGSESCIHPLTFTSFERTRSLTTAFNARPHHASRPFDSLRSGFIISEGAAVLLLESLPHALKRSAPIYAEIAGYGSTSDAYHITSPPPSGEGAYRAMRLALQHACIYPREVDYINAHATSTILGDRAENTAIKTLMLSADHGKRSSAEVNISSTKGATGHLLGASGAIESIFSVLSIRDGVLPPTLNLTTLDHEMDCNYVPRESQRRKVNVVLSNSFGFGAPLNHSPSQPSSGQHQPTLPPPSSSSSSTIHTLPTDFSSPTSLLSSLAKQDALLCCLPAGATTFSSQTLLIDSAIQAGVKVFFANEYISDILSPHYALFPTDFVGDKIRVRAYLDEKSKAGEIAYMALNGGPFFDMWLSKGPAGFDIGRRKARIYDTGNTLACWTPLPVVARAVVNMLRSPHANLLNRGVFVCGVKNVTQNAILAALESELGGGGEQFAVERVALEPIKEAAMKALQRGEWKDATRGLALWFNFKEGVSRADFWSRVENELVGVQAVGVDEAVRSVLTGMN